jgi:hypothetical protein
MTQMPFVDQQQDNGTIALLLRENINKYIQTAGTLLVVTYHYALSNH